MGIGINTARRVINVIDRAFELMKLLKELTNEEYDMLIRSFEKLQKNMHTEEL